ncbi:MAG: twin-arginine translocase subunit TatB, partial [Desulfuromonadales bacterium]|nr:twin-arginine translocase subunit TatB [Desulfuromonadales bacterium]NIS43849.1 twin-arginine translocase subunit TatB [Desulfuromonadales bacterium]
MDFGWSELLVIGIVALIVVGPKDLPGMFRQLGKFTAKLRRMARDFQRAMEDAADEAGVKETASSLKKMTSAKNMGLD